MNLTALPPEETTKLIELHESGNREALQARIAALRSQRWTLQAIGDPLGVSRSTVQYWERNAKGELPVTPLSPKAIEKAGKKILRQRAHVPPKDREMFPALARSAKRVRSHTPPDSQLRKDAELLDQLIQENIDRTVSYTEIAALMGVTHRAVKARLERREQQT